MKTTHLTRFGLLALASFPLFSGYSQDNPAPPAPAITSTPAPPSSTTPPVISIPKPTRDMAEVLKLTKAGVGDDVVVAYIKNSRSYYSLSANDILHLKEEGISSTVLTAMLTHDTSLRNQAPNQPSTQFNYDQQSYPPGSQPSPGQTIAPPPSQPDLSSGNAQITTPPLVPQQGTQPPPLQSEIVPVAPGPDYYWAPGYWGWNGGWIWIGGGWYPHGYYGWGWRGGWGGFHGGWGGWGRGSHGGSWSGGSHGGGGWGRSAGGSHGH